ncbi:AAA family ATPase [Mucilaginibacter sp. BT774]|uniref:AAA family ATPase n=1 Tax=Mucilaginibacter sp. BT774 TaxID=3062276 RepID=UPI002676341E|nr:AAA family ATPase [Mucilaginibacter sp. BT774]MDO3628159.1 AAA family ATPase [Mucilaginibacter sp. BT774]
MSNNPQLLYVAGPNGAGKSTFSKELSNPGAIIFDVDKVIARIEAQSPGMPKKKVYDTATQEFFNQANEAVRQRQHFTLETNFRDKELVDIATQFKRRGYTTNMVYLTLDSIEQSIYRVNKRVLNGGHFVDHKNIQLNYDEGLLYLERYADSFDNLEIVDGSKDFSEFKSILSIKQQELIYLSTNLPTSVEQTVINIANRYRGNPRNEDNDEEQDSGYSRGR